MKRVLPLLLIFALLLCACGPKEPTVESVSPSPSESPSVEPSAEPSDVPSEPPKAEVNLAVLSGPTGVGAAKLLADNDAGTTTNHYNVTVAADNQQVSAGLINGEFDIAAVATNVASNLYHKTQVTSSQYPAVGGVQIAAINTLGVLYILGKGVDDTLDTSSMASLKGRTVYATGQGANPEYVLNYLLTENGVQPSEVDIQWMAAEEVTATMLQAEGDAICMLPVPAATALIAKSEGNVQPIFDLSAEWDALKNGSQLTMGCVVVNTQFAAENPDVVDAFLEEYQASIEYVKDNPEEMAQTVADLGIAPSAPIAQKAIPQCNLTFLAGEDMRSAIQGYYEALYAADPASIGGSIPDDGFYYMGQ